MRLKGFKVQVNRQLNVADGINAVRTLFPQLYFDAALCADGLQYLRRYQWGPPTQLGVPRSQPLHDDASHPADALRTMAVGIKEPERPYKPAEEYYQTGSDSWMA
jgi:phage terminase large subunit